MQLDFATRFTSILLFTTVFSACGNGGHDSHSFTLGGSISGLTGSGLILTEGDQQVSPSSGATSFTFPNALESGTNYTVQVSASPSGLTCGVTHSTGTIGGNVTSVAVTCFPSADTVLHSFTGGADGASPQGSLIQSSDGNFYGMTSVGGSSNLGTVFMLTPDGTETVLHSFVGGTSDGASPPSSLVEGSDGNFYGMTLIGGSSNLGTVFKIAPDGTETVLHSFTGSTSDGSSPHGSLILANDGNFYGMTTAGGSANLGVIFKIAADGTETILYSFVGGTDGASPEGSLIQGTDSNLYGMTHSGGSASQGTVFKIALDGTESVLYSFNSTLKDGTSPRGSLIQGSDGNFYGMTTIGGNLNLGAVFKITPDGTENVLYAFGSTANDGITPYGSLILGSDGNLYGTTIIGGSLNLGTVFKITPDGTKTALYSFAGGTGDGASPQGDLVLGSDGSLYGMTTAGGSSNLGTVFKVPPQ